MPQGRRRSTREHFRIGLFQIAIFLAAALVIAALGSERRARRWQAEDTAHRYRDTLAQHGAALEKIRVLTGLLPVCASCKSIRDQDGNWRQMEAYISEHSEAKFSHGMCPACFAKRYGDLGASEPESHLAK